MSEITLPNGDVMKCTLRATKKINADFGSFMDAARRLDTMDFGSFVAIVAAGTNKKREDVEEDVFNIGMKDLHKSLTDYILLMSNAGRSLDEEAPQKGE